MKITTFKVPIKLVRGPEGVSLTVNEEEKTIFKERSLDEGSENEILKLSKQVSDHNEKQKAIAKSMMLKDEKEREGFILMEFLT